MLELNAYLPNTPNGTSLQPSFTLKQTSTTPKPNAAGQSFTPLFEPEDLADISGIEAALDNTVEVDQSKAEYSEFLKKMQGAEIPSSMRKYPIEKINQS